jgi:ligand-binding sensor domain-containing protein/signal transduction histidine kinase/DNA-binding response OmpR family regulator
MLRTYILALGFLLACFATSGQADEFLFRKISPPEGFTYGNIKTIAEDNKGFIWFGTEHGLYKYDSRKLEKYTRQNRPYSIQGDNVEKVLKDNRGRLWVLTTEGISIFNEQIQGFVPVRLKSQDDERPGMEYTEIIENSAGELFVVRYYKIYRLNLKDSLIQSVDIRFRDDTDAVSQAFFDNNDKLWIGTIKGCIYRSQPPYHDFEYICHHRTDRIQSICQDNATLWIGYEFKGADHINQQGLIIEYYSETNITKNRLPSDRVRSIVKDASNRVWIGTYNGIALITRDDTHIIKKDFYNNLPHNSVHSLFVDSKNGLWTGTWSGGLAYLNTNDNQFIHFNRNQDHKSINSNIVISFCEDSNNNIWIATEDGGLSKFKPREKEFESYSVDGQAEGPSNIKCIVADKNNRIWIGTFGKGLWTFNPVTGRYEKASILNSDINNIYAILPQERGIWIGTYGTGLYFFDNESGRLTEYQNDLTNPSTISSRYIRVLLSDSYGGLWVGTQNGLNYKASGSESFNRYFLNNTVGLSISNNQIFALFEDSKGQIWIGTGGGGANCYHPGSGSITVLKKSDGLAGNIVFGILEDKQGNIWFSTENGISRYSPDIHQFKNFTVEDGLQGKQFNPSAAFASGKGEFFFGGPNGFNIIHPENLAENPVAPDVLITSLEINNEKVNTDSPVISSLYPVNGNGRLKLNHQQNTLTFEFVSNNFIQPAKNQFKYRMINYQDEWINTGAEGKAIFTKVPPGNYTFEVIGSNNDGIWSTEPTVLEINIMNPFWRTKLAYLIYFMIALVSAWAIRKEIVLRNKLKSQLLIEKVQRENEEKLHQLKLQFFTNISHEFRTPLTLILSPLENIMSKKYHDTYTKEHLSMIQRNAQRLKMLINQIIDFRRFELGKIEYIPVKSDIVQLCMGICGHFEVYARDKSISFSLVSSFKKFETEIDPEKFDKIIFNLLSNAFKFTPEGGNISVKIEETEIPAPGEKVDFSTNPDLKGKVLAIRISDTGPGIPVNQIPNIFERFNRVIPGSHSQGTGIGLNLAREYTRLHGGAITVERLPEKGVTFSVLIPQKENQKTGEQKSGILKYWIEKDAVETREPESQLETTSAKKDHSTSVLVVEDNIDMQKQIKHLLMYDYKVVTASNGIQGLELAKEIYPDIIVSDVVMPGIDGIELCKRIKDDLQTSHIPVILLTALSEDDKHIVGLETGADAYIVKPFDNKVLMAQIRNLLKSRERMQKSYRESEEKWATDSNLSQREKSFVEKSELIVEKHLLNPNFSVDHLADELGVSRSSLHRKLRVLTNQSATEFMRYVRMKKALKLMKEGNLNIDEIGFAVGFNSHSYFSQCFKKLYGKTPTEYQAELKMNKQENKTAGK